MNRTAPPHKQFGFTLMELMIVVAVIGIITAIALPGYQSYSRKAKRADAHQGLNVLSQLQERFFTENNTYATTVAELNASADSMEDFWTLSVTAANASSYTLSAAPKNPHIDADCLTITLDSTGVRASTPAGNDCWAGR